MTDKEKAIVMAHTGICMLTGDKFQIFHKYVEDIMGRPVMTHEIGFLADTIKEKTKADFIALCMDESGLENPNRWIPVSEMLPEENGGYLVTVMGAYVTTALWVGNAGYWSKITAWMPLPEPYKADMRGSEDGN